MNDWYTIENIEELDSPALVVYPDRVKHNIKTLINSVADVSNLRPHIKTHKSSQVTSMMLSAGISKFKCATIAEAEMLGNASAPDVLLAYQPVGPKAKRFAEIVTRYPKTKWSCLIDNEETAQDIGAIFTKAGLTINAFIDLNVGMNRSGIFPEKALALHTACSGIKGLTIVGLHAYDGHLRDRDFAERSKKCDEAFQRVTNLAHDIEKKSGKRMLLVVGGTPTFSIHRKRAGVECSPGTFIYWDKGYEDILTEQEYDHAALVITRVISIPAENLICTDLGHKAIASENPLPNRVSFLNAPELEPVGHSEEHMVFKVPPGKKFAVGDVLYGVPYHICPTVALHDIAHAVVNNRVNETWQTSARRRRITV